MRYKKYNGLSEFQECVRFTAWLEKLPRIKEMTHHSPNELCRDKTDAVKMKEIGMSNGFPDYFIAIPGNHYSGLFIEMKRRDKRNEVAPETQLGWINRLNNYGYFATFAFGAEDAKRIVINYIDDTNLTKLF